MPAVTIRSVLESDLENRIRDDAWRLLQIRSIKLKLGQDAHWPDRLFVLPHGDVLWIEFKAPGEELRPGQESRINFLIAMGHDVEIHDTYAGAWDALTTRMKQYD